MPHLDVPLSRLVIDEILTNAAVHAPGPVAASLSMATGHPVFTAEDNGPGFVPPDATPGQVDDRGRGLRIVRALAASFVVGRSEAGGAIVCAGLPVLDARGG